LTPFLLVYALLSIQHSAYSAGWVENADAEINFLNTLDFADSGL